MARYFIDPVKDKVIREDMCTVALEKSDGERIGGLLPKRLFPFTDPDHYVTLTDEEFNEIGVVRDMTELNESSREAIEECFGEFYMIPKITHVYDVIVKYGTVKWDVETDRGRVLFRIRNINSDIKMLGDERIIIRDSNDNRYEIPNVNELDKFTLRKIFSFI